MINLDPIEKQAAYWPMREMLAEIMKLQTLVISHEEAIVSLKAEVERLEETKANRAGRKKK